MAKKEKSTVTHTSVPVNVDRPLSSKQVESYALVSEGKAHKVYSYMIAIMAISILSVIVSMYVIFSRQVSAQIASDVRTWYVISAFALRIALLTFSSLYMLRIWFKKPIMKFQDTAFLFGMFFLILAFGKLYGLLMNLVFFQVDEATSLTLSKIRIIFVYFTMLPMIYLSIGMILLYFSKKYPSLENEARKNNIRISIIFLISIIVLISVAMAPSLAFTGILVAVITLLSLIIITWLFFFAYRKEKLPEIHPLVVGLGFLAYLASSIIRSVLQNIMGITVEFAVLAEIIDILVLILIFTGLLMKAKY